MLNDLLFVVTGNAQYYSCRPILFRSIHRGDGNARGARDAVVFFRTKTLLVSYFGKNNTTALPVSPNELADAQLCKLRDTSLENRGRLRAGTSRLYSLSWLSLLYSSIPPLAPPLENRPHKKPSAGRAMRTSENPKSIRTTFVL